MLRQRCSLVDEELTDACAKPLQKATGCGSSIGPIRFQSTAARVSSAFRDLTTGRSLA